MGPISVFQSPYLASHDDYHSTYLVHHIISQYKMHLNEFGWYAEYKNDDAELKNFIQFWLLGG